MVWHFLLHSFTLYFLFCFIFYLKIYLKNQIKTLYTHHHRHQYQHLDQPSSAGMNLYCFNRYILSLLNIYWAQVTFAKCFFTSQFIFWWDALFFSSNQEKRKNLTIFLISLVCLLGFSLRLCFIHWHIQKPRFSMTKYQLWMIWIKFRSKLIKFCYFLLSAPPIFKVFVVEALKR